MLFLFLMAIPNDDENEKMYKKYLLTWSVRYVGWNSKWLKTHSTRTLTTSFSKYSLWPSRTFGREKEGLLKVDFGSRSQSRVPNFYSTFVHKSTLLDCGSTSPRRYGRSLSQVLGIIEIKTLKIKKCREIDRELLRVLCQGCHQV